MKIEKINENQIRCTLTKEDLISRKINLTELAYGSDKAKDLFREMLKMAGEEFGFEVDNLPLMVEAIPMMPDTIILIITKVENPEELDARFSRFSESRDSGPSGNILSDMTGADDIIDLFKKLTDAGKAIHEKRNAQAEAQPQSASKEPSENKAAADVRLVRIFEFYHLDDAITAAGALKGFATGRNTLYKFGKDTSYQLVLHQSDLSPEDFNRVCNSLSEYARGEAFTEAGEAYLREHGQCMIKDQALAKLSRLA